MKTEFRSKKQELFRIGEISEKLKKKKVKERLLNKFLLEKMRLETAIDYQKKIIQKLKKYITNETDFGKQIDKEIKKIPLLKEELKLVKICIDIEIEILKE